MYAKRVARWMVSAVPVAVLAVAGVARLSVAEDKKPPAPAPKEMTIIETARSAGNFTTFTKLVEIADLTTTLSGKGPFTVFAPTDEAFTKLPKGTLDEWMLPTNKAKLQGILKFHVVSGKHTAAEVKAMKSIKTMQGQSLTIEVKEDKVLINGATLGKADTTASNGVIHTIDTVLMPKETTAATPARPTMPE